MARLSSSIKTEYTPVHASVWRHDPQGAASNKPYWRAVIVRVTSKSAWEWASTESGAPENVCSRSLETLTCDSSLSTFALQRVSTLNEIDTAPLCVTTNQVFLSSALDEWHAYILRDKTRNEDETARDAGVPVWPLKCEQRPLPVMFVSTTPTGVGNRSLASLPMSKAWNMSPLAQAAAIGQTAFDRATRESMIDLNGKLSLFHYPLKPVPSSYDIIRRPLEAMIESASFPETLGGNTTNRLDELILVLNTPGASVLMCEYEIEQYVIARGFRVSHLSYLRQRAPSDAFHYLEILVVRTLVDVVAQRHRSLTKLTRYVEHDTTHVTDNRHEEVANLNFLVLTNKLSAHTMRALEWMSATNFCLASTIFSEPSRVDSMRQALANKIQEMALLTVPDYELEQFACDSANGGYSYVVNHMLYMIEREQCSLPDYMTRVKLRILLLEMQTLNDQVGSARGARRLALCQFATRLPLTPSEVFEWMFELRVQCSSCTEFIELVGTILYKDCLVVEAHLRQQPDSKYDFVGLKSAIECMLNSPCYLPAWRETDTIFSDAPRSNTAMPRLANDAAVDALDTKLRSHNAISERLFEDVTSQAHANELDAALHVLYKQTLSRRAFLCAKLHLYVRCMKLGLDVPLALPFYAWGQVEPADIIELLTQRLPEWMYSPSMAAKLYNLVHTLTHTNDLNLFELVLYQLRHRLGERHWRELNELYDYFVARYVPLQRLTREHHFRYALVSHLKREHHLLGTWTQSSDASSVLQLLDASKPPEVFFANALSAFIELRFLVDANAITSEQCQELSHRVRTCCQLPAAPQELADALAPECLSLGEVPLHRVMITLRKDIVRLSSDDTTARACVLECMRVLMTRWPAPKYSEARRLAEELARMGAWSFSAHKNVEYRFELAQRFWLNSSSTLEQAGMLVGIIQYEDNEAPVRSLFMHAADLHAAGLLNEQQFTDGNRIMHSLLTSVLEQKRPSRKLMPEETAAAHALIVLKARERMLTYGDDKIAARLEDIYMTDDPYARAMHYVDAQQNRIQACALLRECFDTMLGSVEPVLLRDVVLTLRFMWFKLDAMVLYAHEKQMQR